MRKNFGAQTWLYPMPVLMIGTYDENGTPDLMNAAWGGIYDTNKITVCIDPAHKTAENLLKSREFTVSIGDAGHVSECDYVGIVSGNDEPEKFQKSGLHAERAEFVNAPVVAELPMTLECRLLTFDEKTGCTVAEIVNISADESILDDTGRIDPVKLAPITYDPVHHTYIKLGEVVGKAFSDGKALCK